MKEREKIHELKMLHENFALLLANCYDGPDNIEAQYQFLERNYNIKREQIEESYFIRAKAIHIRKKAADSQTVSRLKTTRREKPRLSNPLNEYYTMTESKTPQGPSALSTAIKNATDNLQPKTTKSATIYTKYVSKLESSLSDFKFPYFSKIGKDKNTQVVKLEKEAKSSYKSLSKIKKPKGGPNYFNLNETGSSVSRNTFFVTAHLSTEPNDQSESSLAIDRMNETLSKPFFVHDRAIGNQTTRHLYPRTEESLSVKSSGIKLNSRLTTEFPIHKDQDFVKRHAEGFKNTHNGDLFQHVFRILLRNQHLLTKKKFSLIPIEIEIQKTSQITNKGSKENENDVNYAPIEAKVFVIDQNIDRFTVLEKLANLYEEKNQIRLSDYFEEVNYEDPSKISEEFERENFLIEYILNKINTEGLSSLNLADMVAFKSIVKKRLQLFSNLQGELQKEQERASSFLPNLFQTSSLPENLLTQTSKSISGSNMKLLLLNNSNSGTMPPDHIHVEGNPTRQGMKISSNPAISRADMQPNSVRKLSKFITQQHATTDRRADKALATESDTKHGHSYKSVLDSIYHQLARVDYLNIKIKKAQERIREAEFDSESSMEFNSPHNSVKSRPENNAVPDLFLELQQLNDDPINYDEIHSKPIPLQIQMSPRNIIGRPSPNFLDVKAKEEALQLEQVQLKNLKNVRDMLHRDDSSNPQRVKKEGALIDSGQKNRIFSEDQLLEAIGNEALGDDYQEKDADNEQLQGENLRVQKKKRNPNIGARTGYFSNISPSLSKDKNKKITDMLQNDKIREQDMMIFKKLTTVAEESEKKYQQDLKKHLNQIAKQSATLLTMNKITAVESKVKQHIAEFARKVESKVELEEHKEIEYEANKVKNIIEETPQILIKDADKPIILPNVERIRSKNPKTRLQEDVMKRYLPSNVSDTFSKGFKKTFEIEDANSEVTKVELEEDRHSQKNPEKLTPNNFRGPKFTPEINLATPLITPERLDQLEDMFTKTEGRVQSAQQSAELKLSKASRSLSDFDVDNRGNLITNSNGDKTPGHPTDTELLSRYGQSSFGRSRISKDGLKDEYLLLEELQTETLYKWRLKRLTRMRQKVYQCHTIDIIQGSDLPVPIPVDEIEHVKRMTLSKRRHSMFDRRMLAWQHALRSLSSASTHRAVTRQGLESRSGDLRPETRDKPDNLAFFNENVDQTDQVIEKFLSIDKRVQYRDDNDKLRSDLYSAESNRKSLSSGPKTQITFVDDKPSSGDRWVSNVMKSSISLEENKDAEGKSPTKLGKNIIDGQQKRNVKLSTRAHIPEETDTKQKTMGLLTVRGFQGPQSKIFDQSSPGWTDSNTTNISSPGNMQHVIKQKNLDSLAMSRPMRPNIAAKERLPALPKATTSKSKPKRKGKAENNKKEKKERKDSDSESDHTNHITEEVSPQRTSSDALSSQDLISPDPVISRVSAGQKNMGATSTNESPKAKDAVQKTGRKNQKKAVDSIPAAEQLIPSLGKLEEELEKKEQEENAEGMAEKKAGDIGSPHDRHNIRELIRQMRHEAWNPDEITKALLDDPLRVFNEVLHQDTLDNETKLDLFLYGSRKEQLRDYIKQIESNIEDNIMAQGDCNDQLKSFFDFKIKENKPKVELKFSQNLILPNDHAEMIYTDSRSEIDEDEDDVEDGPEGLPRKKGERRNAYKTGSNERGDLKNWQGSFILRDLKEENIRKANFKAQMRLLARLKAATQKDDGIIQEQIVDPKNPNHESLVIQPYGPREAKKKKSPVPEDEEDHEMVEMIKRFKKLVEQLRAQDPEKVHELMLKLQMMKSEFSNQFTNLENQHNTLKMVRILT